MWTTSLVLLLPVLQTEVGTQSVSDYVPSRSAWERLGPAEAGFDAERLTEAVRVAQDAESDTPIALDEYIAATFGHEPHSEIVGPTRERAAQNGMLLRGGYIVAEWGDTLRPDMTFSVTKTYLSTLVGLALQDGLIESVHESVGARLGIDEFAGEWNERITWDHLLRQTSDWRGTLWGKADWADRPPAGGLTDEQLRAQPRNEPGTTWKYNDVRVNLLAYAALELWREPLPRVLRGRVMDRIGASRTWHWHGYSTSWTTVDGLRVESVSGGGHHGGGMFVSTRDQARFGLLMQRNGMWGEERIVAGEWIDYAREPTPVRPTYGVMNWFLNTPGIGEHGELTRPLPSAPEEAVTFRGAGSNIVYLDAANDMVLVLRWVDRSRLDEIIGAFLAAVEQPTAVGAGW